MIVAMPVVFVAIAAPFLGDVGRVLGSGQDESAVQRLTAGWTAAFVSAIAEYFQVAGALLAAGGAGVAVATLAVSEGLVPPALTLLGTAMFAAIYLGFGAVVGALVRNPVNGTVVLLLVWILDVFFGPGLGASRSATLQAMPTHHLSLWITGTGTDDLPRALAWTAGSLAAAYVAVLTTTSVGRPRRVAVGTAAAQLVAGLRAAARSWRRNPVLWVLLAAVPAVFVLLADATTPDGSTPVTVREGGVLRVMTLNPAEIHAGTMAPIAIGTLAAVAGVFVGLEAQGADGRLALAGQRRWVLATTRLATAGLAAVVSAAASLGVTALVFEPEQWETYALGNGLLAFTYALIGILIGPAVGTVRGVLLAFLVSFVDLALGQSPMLRPEPPVWATVLPGYGSNRVLMDGALTATFDEVGSLVVALVWLIGLAVAVQLAGLRRSEVRRAT